MFDEMGSKIDAVFVATPDHTHAVASLAAIRAGKHVYCEKPLTHDIYEARILGEEARKHRVMTQMGNQGHGGNGIRLLREYLEAGAIGTVTEVHSWQDQRDGTRIRHPDAPVPPGVDWDEWLGPTPAIPYRPGLHPSVGGQNDDTGVGEGWYQLKPYGTGLLLCVGAHVCDPPHWALQLKYPSTCVCLEQRGERPIPGDRSTGCLRVPPARAPHGEVLLVRRLSAEPEHQGLGRLDPDPSGPGRRGAKEVRRDLPGRRDALHRRQGHHVVQHLRRRSRTSSTRQQHKATPVPARKYPRIPPSKSRGFQSQADYLRACLEGGQPPCSNFPDVSGPYIEALLVGDLAMRAGVGKKLEWDGVKMKCTNMPEMNHFVKPEYRPGWGL